MKISSKKAPRVYKARPNVNWFFFALTPSFVLALAGCFGAAVGVFLKIPIPQVWKLNRGPTFFVR